MASPSKNQNYAYLSRLSTQKLLELLAAAPRPQNARGQSYIDAIVEVVLEREERHPTGLLPDPEQAWRSFSSTIIPRRGRTCPSTRQRTPEQPHQNQPPLRQSTGPKEGQNATFFDALS